MDEGKVGLYLCTKVPVVECIYYEVLTEVVYYSDSYFLNQI